MAMTSDLVSSTIVARAREPEGLRKMMIVSAAAHSIAVVAIVIAPFLFGPHRPQETIMEVSITSGASTSPCRSVFGSNRLEQSGNETIRLDVPAERIRQGVQQRKELSHRPWR